MGFKIISEDSSEISFLLVENVSLPLLPTATLLFFFGVNILTFCFYSITMTTPIWLRLGRESLETCISYEIPFFFSLRSAPMWADVKKKYT
jgi:hypothetical protein